MTDTNLQYCQDAALARVQRVWVVPEEGNGKSFPLPKHLIKPTGDVSINQETPTQDSQEKADTLDVLNVHQSIASPGTVTIPMYIKSNGMDQEPQGDALLCALMGQAGPKASGTVTAQITDSATEFSVSGITGRVPQRGVLKLADALTPDTFELVHYLKYESSKDTPNQVTFSGITRGYGGTTPLTFEIDDTVTVHSRWYMQNKCRQNVSVWVQTDFLLKCLDGARVTDCTVPVEVGGAVNPSFTLNGRRAWAAGRSDMNKDATSSSTSIVVDDARAFFEGMRIRNATKGDDNNGSGYSVKAVNTTTNTLTLLTGISKAWSVDDVITWWMPSGGESAEHEIESRDTTVLLDGQKALLKSGNVQIGTPSNVIELIGDRYPGLMLDGQRQITATVSMLMKQDAAVRITEGFDGIEKRIDYEFGLDDGGRVALVLPRAKLTTTAESFQDPTVFLDSTARALGFAQGENSLELILE